MTNLDHLSTETLADYAEDLLRESEASAVATHLSGCADCRAEELLLAALSDILAADSPGPMPAMYAARIDKALAKVAMTDPLSGSFHSEGSAYHGAALDLTPSAFAASTPTGGPAGPSANVVDLSARRRLVAQGLSRVSTVAASIVLLIGGTVLGLQAVNSGDANPSPDSVAIEADGAEATVQPSIATRATAVPIDKDAKKNPDGSFTNKNGTIVRKDGTAVTPDGKVIAVPKIPKGPGTDPAQLGGGTKEPEAPPLVTGKSNGSVPAARAEDQPLSGPVVPDDRISPVGPPGDTGEPPATAGEPTQEPETSSEPTTEPQQKPADAQQSAPQATEEPSSSRVSKSAVDSNKEPYFRQSGDTYNTDNFARKVLDLLERGGFTASSTGAPVVDPEPDPSVDPASDPAAPAPDTSPSSSQAFTPSSVAVAMTNPGSAGAATAPDAAAAVGPAAFEARAVRCAQDFDGRLRAADEGRWDGKTVTVIVMTDPTDENQVVGRIVAGGCNDRKPAKDNVQYTQYVVVRAAES